MAGLLAPEEQQHLAARRSTCLEAGQAAPPPISFSTVIDTTTGNSQGSVNVGDTSTGFHDYGVLWTPQTITFYFDGRELFSTPTPLDMNSPMYMIMDLALGGSWSEAPSARTPAWALANMKVDYVRAYSLTPTATPRQAPTVTFRLMQPIPRT